MGPEEVEQIAEWIDRLLQHPKDPALRHSVREEVSTLCRRFALPS
jgi:glycine/serine hydroxymethyltransferase